MCVREKPRAGAWVCHVAGKVDASDSVGTSGRKGRESAEAFPSRMGTLGLQRLGVGSGVKAWPRKRLNVVARRAQAGRGSARGAEVVLLGLVWEDREGDGAFCSGDRRGQFMARNQGN